MIRDNVAYSASCWSFGEQRFGTKGCDKGHRAFFPAFSPPCGSFGSALIGVLLDVHLFASARRHMSKYSVRPSSPLFGGQNDNGLCLVGPRLRLRAPWRRRRRRRCGGRRALHRANPPPAPVVAAAGKGGRILARRRQTRLTDSVRRGPGGVATRLRGSGRSWAHASGSRGASSAGEGAARGGPVRGAARVLENLS